MGFLFFSSNEVSKKELKVISIFQLLDLRQRFLGMADLRTESHCTHGRQQYFLFRPTMISIVSVCLSDSRPAGFLYCGYAVQDRHIGCIER